MNNMHRTALGAGLALVATAADAQGAATGWYVGIGVGASNFPDSVPAQIAAAYSNNSTYTLQSARTTDSGDTAAQLFAGYRFLPWLAVEAGYRDLGNARTVYQLNPIVQLNYPMPTLAGTYGVRSADAALVATWPVNERFELLARGGISNTRLSYDEHGFDINNQPYAFHARTRSHSGATVGIGAAWNFSSSFALRFDIDRVFDVGRTFALNTEGNGRFDHVDAYTVNLVWRP